MSNLEQPEVLFRDRAKQLCDDIIGHAIILSSNPKTAEVTRRIESSAKHLKIWLDQAGERIDSEDVKISRQIKSELQVIVTDAYFLFLTADSGTSILRSFVESCEELTETIIEGI